MSPFKTISISFIIITFLSHVNLGLHPNHAIYQKLFANYYHDIGPINVDPVSNRSVAITILIKPQLISIVDVNEADETVTLTLWFNMHWNDSRLTWNPAEFNNIESITVHDSKIWLPDIMMYEMLSVMRSEVLPYYARLSYTGEVSYSNSLVTRIHCQLDVRDFPYDTQNCTMTYSSWTHTGAEMILKSRTGNEADKSNYKKGAEWELGQYTAKEVVNVYTSETYYEVHFYFILIRKPQYYVLTLTFPCYLIVAIAILGLFSPFIHSQERQERVTLGLTALLTIAVILMTVADVMPKSSLDFPMLGDFIRYEMILISIATLVAVCVMYLNSQATFGHSVPNFLYRITFLKRLLLEKHTIGTDWSTRVETAQTRVSIDSKRDENVRVLHNILDILKALKSKLETNEADDQLTRHWMHICFRLDMFFLVLFTAIQLCLTAFYTRIF